MQIIDEIITVPNEDAMQTDSVGFHLVLPLWAALQVARWPQTKEKIIVVIMPETGEKYRSTDLVARLYICWIFWRLMGENRGALEFMKIVSLAISNKKGTKKIGSSSF